MEAPAIAAPARPRPLNTRKLAKRALAGAFVSTALLSLVNKRTHIAAAAIFAGLALYHVWTRRKAL